MIHRGTIVFKIGDNIITRTYISKAQRANLIESYLPLRLEGQECYYTIKPPDRKVIKPSTLRTTLITDTKLSKTERWAYWKALRRAKYNQIRMLYVAGSRSRGRNSLQGLFGISSKTASQILKERTPQAA